MTVRESLHWSQIDGEGNYDFSEYECTMKIARDMDMQIIWSLNHFDYPEHLDPFSSEFVRSFAKYATEAVNVIRQYDSDTLYIIPINEISFFAYIGGTIGHWAPFAKKRGVALKKQLVKASIAAMKAIWKTDSNVVFIHTDPIVYRIPKNPRKKHQVFLQKKFLRHYFQAWDMLSGRLYPELGGNPKYLQIIGGNYYIDNQQWIKGKKYTSNSTYETIPWSHGDRITMAQLLKGIYARYGKPFVISETGSFGANRKKFWKRTLKECDQAMESGVPVYGICAYPAVDRPDWDDFHLTNSGLWDTLKRRPHRPSIELVREFALKHSRRVKLTNLHGQARRITNEASP